VSKPVKNKQYNSALVWFRRDLRDYDQAALYYALKAAKQVYCVFIFDTDILDTLQSKTDMRVDFIWQSVQALQQSLRDKGGDLIILHGKATDEVPKLASALNIDALFYNHDYEPSATARDQTVNNALPNTYIHHYKDHVIFEKDEILTLANKPYTVFTPYKNNWRKTVNYFYLSAYPVDLYTESLAMPNNDISSQSIAALSDIGFKQSNLNQLPIPTGMAGGLALFKDFSTRMEHYHDARNFPAIKGVSYLSVHLRFGTISTRHLAREAFNSTTKGAETWLNELIWRDFYAQILFHNPSVASGHAFKSHFNQLAFPNNHQFFQAWCDGNTGYPLVDAAMRQLNQTGYMHNRLRMVAASFLVKDLQVDWRLGEAYFAEKLIDFDFASNNGGWQWAASTGCDAQPWFRIFNPISQSEKFDAKGKFIRKYVPELALCSDKEIHAPWKINAQRLADIQLLLGEAYPYPVVDHSLQRESTLSLYKSAQQQ